MQNEHDGAPGNGPDDGQDPFLKRLFAELRVPLADADFSARLEQRLRHVRRRQLLSRALAVAAAIAVLVVTAPSLINASLAMCIYMSGESISVGQATEVPLIWIASGMIGGFVLLRTRRGLRR